MSIATLLAVVVMHVRCSRNPDQVSGGGGGMPLDPPRVNSVLS